MDSPAPIDHIVLYLTAGLGVGQRLKIETIDRRLRRLPLRQSLIVLSQLCFKMDEASAPPAPIDVQIQIAEQVFPASFLPAASRLLRSASPRMMALSPQVLVLLGVRLLAVSLDDVDGMDADQLARELGSLALALGDHVDAAELTAESTILEILRLGLFYGRSGHAGWLDLAGRLFFDVLPRLSNHPDWSDPLARFRSGTGLTLEKFWAITSTQAAAAAHSPHHFIFPINIEDRPISASELAAWSRLLISSLPASMSAARIDMTYPLAWSMSSVWKRPIVDLGEGRGPVLRGALLEMQTEPAQMFWHLRDELDKQGLSHESWSRLYGDAVETLGMDLLREYLTPDSVLSESEFIESWTIPPSSKRADAAVVTPSGDLVVIDFVSRQFTRETTTTGDFAALAKDLKLGVIEKLEQVDVTLRYAVQAEEGTERIFPLVVIAGAFPMIPPLDDAISRGLVGRMQVIDADPRCRKWMVLDLLSLLLLLRVSKAIDTPITDLLDEWQSSPLARNEFREWALRLGPARNLPGGGLPSEGFERVRRYLGLSQVDPHKPSAKT